MAFDISTISSDFRNELEGGLYNLAVKEGTVWNMVEQFNGIAGKQDLNTLDFDPTWKNVGGADGSTYAADYDTQAGTVDLGRRVIDVKGEWFSVGLNQIQLDQTFARASQSEDPQAYAAQAIAEQAAAKMRERVSAQFYTGFSAAADNGLLDVGSTTVVNTGTDAKSATTIIGKLATMHAAVAGSTHANRQDLMFVLSSSDYLFYRQGLRAAGLNDVLQSDASVAGVGLSPWIDDTNISVVMDPNYTGEPMLFSAANVVFGSKNLSENEQADLFYSKDKNIYIVRAYIYGGVQALEPGNIFINANAA